jgi:enoyl-CoA hydratase
MLLTAETYSAERLHLSGGVHRLGELDDALGWADEIASLAPLTIAAHKVALEGLGEPLGTLDSLSSIEVVSAIEMARRAAWASVDAEEGRTAFLAKRRPEFTGH